jgi:hypothetical protein
VTVELQILIGSIIGGTGALVSYWAGWRARGGVIGRRPLIFNEGRTQPRPSKGVVNPPPSEP